MNYPQTLKLEYLESQHEHYKDWLPTWLKIHHLVEGGHLLEKNKEAYLPKRAGEEQAIYQTRISKFTYQNLLGSAIQQQSAKLTAGSYSISNVDDEFWSNFRENIDSKGRSERDLIGRLFRTALQFGSCYIQVDKPKAAVKPINKLQERQLGLRPYLVLYTPMDVIDWEEAGDSLSMVKIRQVSTYRANIFTKPLPKATWTIITPEYILKYSALVKLSKDGRILETLDADGKGTPVSEDTTIAIETAVAHGMGIMPIRKFELPSDLYVGNHAYLKAFEHLNLDNIKYDSASLATYIQRVYKPYRVPDEDTSQSFTQESPEEKMLSGNPYILKAESFSFEEMQGTALTVLGNILEKLENQVRDLVALGGLSADKRAVEQSGVSKKLDMALQELVLRAYGALIVDFYQDILQLVAKAAGMVGDPISVNGFDHFELDSLDDLLSVASQIQSLQDLLPPTARKLFSRQLSSQLIKNASAEEQQQINEEIEQTFQAAPAVEDTPSA